MFQEEPFLMEQLYSENAVTADVLQYGSTQHVAYRINQNALEEFTARKRTAARAAGEPESDLVGMHLLKRVETPRGFTLNRIWLYQVPHSKAYLLVVTGYEPVNRKAFCGSLSLFCPNVFDPLESKIINRFGRSVLVVHTRTNRHLPIHVRV